MVVNLDEAERCLEIAQKKLASGDIQGAEKFARKSINLHKTHKAEIFLENMALQFHPDKNSAPGADEAFKIVSHAFTTLSDSSKRTHYDQFGSTSMSSSSFASASSNNYSRNFNSFESDINPEDLFNMFFGGNMNDFGSNFGPRVRVRKFGNARFANAYQRHANQNTEQDENRGLAQLIPIIGFILIIILSAFIGNILDPTRNDPNYTFTKTYNYNNKKSTNKFRIPYYVNKNEFNRADLSSSDLHRFESKIEEIYISSLRNECYRQTENKQRMINDASGFLGFGVDRERLDRANRMKLPACQELNSYI
ncbi:hypothetical protein BB558_001861 [Smittium angustum]|uniref:J domain-containing protein n=1 Tax=Smittium angustum TaxID=133377 RepID=A0A2U1JA64_SMIAN|nr:hypothetical protein BB558_001861 [Smittium angustum]